MFSSYLKKISKDTASLFTRHRAALLLCLLIGLITIAPNLYFISSLGGDYQGLYIMKADAEPYYLSRIREFYDSGAAVNPFIYEYKYNVPPATPGYAEAPVAYLGQLFGISAASAGLASTFILPTLVALLVYSFFFLMSSSRIFALAAAAFVTSGRYLLSVPDILHLLSFEQAYTQFTIFARPVLPAMSFFVFFLYLNALAIAVRQKSFKWFLYAGLMFGTAFYVYFYNYTFLLGLNAILIALFWMRSKREYGKGLFFSTMLGLAVGSYSVFQSMELVKSPYHAGLARALGLLESREFIFSVAGLITFFLFVVYFYRRWKVSILSENDWLVSALLLSAFTALNQQLITGKILQPGHYHWYFNVPIYSIALLYVLCEFSKSSKIPQWIFKCAAFLAMILSLYSAGFEQYSSYAFWQDKVASDQRYMPALRWLDRNTPKESVIFANSKITELVPVFTSGNVVYDAQAFNFFWSEERANWRQDGILKGNPPILDTKKMSEYRLDYFVWDKMENPDWRLDRYSFLKEKYESENISVYKLEI